jgi:hypothetical protein
MDILEILIPVAGLLAVGTFRSLMIKVKKENDYVMIIENILFQAWSVINGIVLPLIVLFSSNKWYMAILYYVIGVVIITNIISGLIINMSKRNNALIPFIFNLITTISFLMYLFL